MRNLPVHWSEGMFLRPHHFQAADRYWSETVQASEQWDHAYNYGLRRLDISLPAIRNSQFQLNSCQARMKDGSLVALDPGQEPDRLNLTDSIASQAKALQLDMKEGLESQNAVRVYLAVPKLKMGAANVADPQAPGPHRFQELKQSLQDESRGGNDQEIGLRLLNVRLGLSTDDLSGYELLPIGQIQRAAESGATPRLDIGYIPPVLAIDAWPPLLKIVRDIRDVVGEKVSVLSQQILSAGVTFASQEPGDLDRLLMLSQLNESFAVLSIWAFAEGMHPLVAYTELCRLVGKLAIFSKERRAQPVPQYDHDNLGYIFYWVRDQIGKLLREVEPPQYEQRPFLGAGRGMQVSLDPRWLNSNWQWYVGVARGNVSERECEELLSAGQLDWKLGSAQQVENLFVTRAEGVKLERLPRPPRSLPATGGWIYYEVSRQGPAWNDVQNKQSLAMRVKEKLILNLDNLQNQRKLVLNYNGKQANLEFALFAVPIRS